MNCVEPARPDHTATSGIPSAIEFPDGPKQPEDVQSRHLPRSRSQKGEETSDCWQMFLQPSAPIVVWYREPLEICASGTLSSQILSVWCVLMDSICRPGPLLSEVFAIVRCRQVETCVSLAGLVDSLLMRTSFARCWRRWENSWICLP